MWCFPISLTVVCFLGILVFAKENSDGVVVTTGVGKIRGNILKTVSNRDFYAFRGVRYAQPPVGPLRFKDPRPIEPWNDVFDATEDGPICPQIWSNSSVYHEDCLRLNVYTHELPSESKSNIRKPVYVYWHPGGFYAMSGHSKFFAGPEYMMDRDIVLVTINYRLGTLGFLATGTREAPGNAGLKDQVMALKWIQKEITRFGGDPDNVTVMGYSAGALSITLHMTSPMSKGLFHKAIVMSASGLSQWRVPSEQLSLARRQARLLNCTDSNIPEMVDCLRTKPYEDYANSLRGMFRIGFLPVLLFKPVIEPDFGQERFLVEDPTKVFQEGRFMRIPVISGITKDEFIRISYDALGNDTFREEFDKNWNELAPIYLQYDADNPNVNDISVTLRKEYLGDSALSYDRSLQGLGKLFSDALIGFSVHRFVHLAARYTKVYYYRFSYQGRWSYYTNPDNTTVGVVHHDDLLYLFTGLFIAPTFTKDYPEYLTVQRLTRMHEAFAHTGNPNKPDDEYLKDLNWTPFDLRKENYLDIGENLEMKEHLYTDRFGVWSRLFPLDWSAKESHGNDDSSEDYPMPHEHGSDHHYHVHKHDHSHDHNHDHPHDHPHDHNHDHKHDHKHDHPHYHNH